MRMRDWLQQRAHLTPDKLALAAERGALTFRQLDLAVERAAALFTSLGVKPRDHVAALLGNDLPAAVAVHALIRCGAVMVPINLRLTPGEMSWQARDAEARWILHDAARETVAQAIIEGWTDGPRLANLDELLDFAVTAEGSEASGDPPTRYIDLQTIQGMIYTSGTTGRPKGALLTLGNHWWNAVASCLNLGLHRDDKWLAVLPLFHVGGLAILFRSVIYGIPIVLHRRFDPAAVNRAIDDEGVTIVSVVSAMLREMLSQRGDQPYPPTLRAFLAGGGPVPRELIERAHRLGAPVIQTYGMTETASQIATLSPADVERKAGSAGKPLFGVEIRIDAAPQQIGEIIVRGPTVSPGYWRGSQEEEAVAEESRVDGWFRTGDLGRWDDEGFLYVVDRRHDLIISGGENVYPKEIEEVLESHPLVLEAAVVGAPDERWGRVPVAWVVLRPDTVTGSDTHDGPLGSGSAENGSAPGTYTHDESACSDPSRTGPAGRSTDAKPGVDAEAIIAYCRERLAPYKVPAAVHFVDRLPRNATGKLLRHRLAVRLPQRGTESRSPLHVVEAGEKSETQPPLIMIHGDFSNAVGSWSNQLAWADQPAFGNVSARGGQAPPATREKLFSLRVIAVDRRGNGDSPKEPRPYTIESDALDVLTAMNDGGVTKGHIVGHSYGGLIAIELACIAPDRVESLHLIEPPLLSLMPDDPDVVALAAATRQLRETGASLPAEELTARFFEMLMGPAALAKIKERPVWASLVREAPRFVEQQFAGDYPADSLKRLEQARESAQFPVIVYTGGRSHIALQKLSRRVAQRVPGARLVEIPHAGHHVQHVGADFDDVLRSYAFG